MKTLSVTEASKSFPKYVNRVHSLKESFAIVKLGVPYALLVPPSVAGCSSHELAEDLAKAKLPAADRRTLAAAIRKGHKALKPVENPWG